MLRALLFALSLVPWKCFADPWTVERREALASPTGVSVLKTSVRLGETTADLHSATFSPSTHTFAVMDDPENAYDLASAARVRGAVVAVNGGYFRPDRTPLGLRVRKGMEIHRLEKAPLLSGLLTVTDRRISLLRVGEFRRSPGLQEALQCGPFLIDSGKPVSGLNATRRAKRTVVLEAAGKRFGLLVTSDITLAEAGAILATPNIVPEMRVTRALNLDGGSSTGFWVASEPPFYLREIRNVRDFVGIVPR